MLFVAVQMKWFSWKWCYAHAYQVSSSCVVPLASLRSEEVRVPEAFCCCGFRGNDVIHMRTSFTSMRAAVKFEEWGSNFKEKSVNIFGADHKPNGSIGSMYTLSFHCTACRRWSCGFTGTIRYPDSISVFAKRAPLRKPAATPAACSRRVSRG